jgi:N4-gp56 family major capsid protein
MAVQTYALLTPEQKTFYDRSLLERLLPELRFAQFGQKKPMPKREGDNVNFRRFNSLSAATTPLTEGVTPAGNALSISTVAATVAQYGDYITLSDKIDMVGIDPVLTETSQLLGEQAGLTIDTIVRNIVTVGTNVQYAAGRASRATVVAGDNLTGVEVRKAVRTLRRQNVKPLEGDKYIGLISADSEYDLMGDVDWKDVSKYSNSKAIFNGEIGELFGVRFIRCGNAPTVSNGAATPITLQQTMILGRDAYGVVDVNGSAKPEMIVKPHGSAGSADPLNQVASSGWKALFTAVRLQELAMVRIEHASTV